MQKEHEYEDTYGNPVDFSNTTKQEADKELGNLYNELNLIYFGGELPANVPVYFNVQLKSTIGRMIYEARTRKVVAIEMSVDAFKRAKCAGRAAKRFWIWQPPRRSGVDVPR